MDDQVAQAFDAPYASVAQTHGNTTIIVSGPDHDQGADGLITGTKDLVLITRAADCQSFVIYAPDHNVIGVLHAGWRGLRDEAIREFFAALKRKWNIPASETYVGIAPSLCVRCAEFSDPPSELPNVDRSFFRDRHVDLMSIADFQLKEAGVRQMERMQDCTCCKADQYWSVRGGDKDKMAEGYRNILACRLL